MIERQQWKKLLKESKDIIEESSQIEPSEIDNRSKQSAINYIHKKIDSLTRGIFNDDNWSNVTKIWRIFDSMNLNWHIESSEYGKNLGELMPSRKTWIFKIEYINKNKITTIGGQLRASGAGSVRDPLDRYDITIHFY